MKRPILTIAFMAFSFSANGEETLKKEIEPKTPEVKSFNPYVPWIKSPLLEQYLEYLKRKENMPPSESLEGVGGSGYLADNLKKEKSAPVKIKKEKQPFPAQPNIFKEQSTLPRILANRGSLVS